MRYNLPGDHPLIGCSAPDFESEDGTRLGEHLHNGKGLLLDLTGGRKLHDLGQIRHDRLNYVSAHVKDSKSLTSILVRPDGVVAWVAESEPDLSTAERSIERWFGAVI
jgi:hypothetical protein